MQTKRRELFTTVRTEGAILPADLLQRIADGDRGLEGLKPEDYHRAGERLNEVVNGAWNRLLGQWQTFQAALAKLPESDAATSVTRERWLLPLFRELDYGRLTTVPAIELNGKSFPISHGWQKTPIHLVGWRVEMDRRTAGVAGAARTSPHSLLQELLNQSDDRLWGFVSNGQRLRILRNNISLTRQAFVEFDLESMMDGEVYADFALLWFLCHQSRVEGDRQEQCWLEKWSRTAQETGTRALDTLRQGVEDAIKALGRGFLAHQANAALRQKLRDGGQNGGLDTQDYYRQILRLVYRLLFLFAAEDRGLLLLPSADEKTRKQFAHYYSTGRLRHLAERHRGTRHCDLYQGIVVVMQKLGTPNGCPELGLPALGGFLWSDPAMPALVDCRIANTDFMEAVRALAFTVDGNVLRPVDYKNLGPEELGSVYESLLELHPKINADAATFELAVAAGHERKTTGSYYTPTSLITCLLDSALDPVLEQAAKKPTSNEAETAILALKVCDPACGSGHFLIAAAHRIAKRLAVVRTGDMEPAPEVYRQALRDVIGHCIFGVDSNSMAVELCKINLWLESLEPGKPLSFLDHHIQSGNSLLGTTPALLSKGIPDEAFTPIEGDDKKLCTEYKKQNRDDRRGQKTFFTGGGKPWERMGDFAVSLASLEQINDDSLEGVRTKEDRYAQIIGSADYLSGRLWADTWCAAFVWKKTKEFDYAITEDVFRRIERNPHDCTPWMRKEIQRLAVQYQFFHWHLAFPQVFRVPADNSAPENKQTGWLGGFDVMLGNPPWEQIEFDPRQFFAQSRPDIADAHHMAERSRLIGQLKDADACLWTAYCDATRQIDGVQHLVHDTGLYPYTSFGRLNLAPLFVEAARGLFSSTGRVGLVVPTGVVTDSYNQYFFQDLLKQRELVSVFDFENRRGLFPAVQGNVKFCLITLGHGHGESFAIGSQLDDTSLLKDLSRVFTLHSDDVVLINPNTKSCPTFWGARDAQLVRKIHTRLPILWQEGCDDGNAWTIQGLIMFMSNSSSRLFRTREELEGSGFRLEGNIFTDGENRFAPYYEAKLLYQYNHRAATYDGIDASRRFRTHAATETPRDSDLDNPDYAIIPRYWITEEDLNARDLSRRWYLGYRKIISAVADSRSLVSSIVPKGAVSDSMPLLLSELPAMQITSLLAALNSFVLDYVLRQKASGANLNLYIMKQLPVPSPTAFLAPSGWSETVVLLNWILPRTLELTYTAWGIKAFAEDCGYTGPPFRWQEERRFLLRCELDAAFFHLYGVEQDEVQYIMGTFPIVRRRDEEKHGEYRTKRVILEIYNAMADAIRTGRPYQTLLDPPPGPPAAGLPDWEPSQPRPANWPSHIHPLRHAARAK